MANQHILRAQPERTPARGSANPGDP